MFGGDDMFSSFSVDDTGRALEFYGGTLGLDARDFHGMVDLRTAGGGRVLIYPKDDHEPARFTVLNFMVPDIDRAVDDLVAAGVTIQRYPGFGHDERGVVRGPEGPAIAWFTDPAGNILSVVEGTASS